MNQPHKENCCEKCAEVGPMGYECVNTLCPCHQLNNQQAQYYPPTQTELQRGQNVDSRAAAPTTMTKELSNKGCCEKYFGKHPLENIGPCCHDSNCPCHQENNKRDIKITNLHCSKHGDVEPIPCCPKCAENAAPTPTPQTNESRLWERDFYAVFGNLRTKPNTTLSENPVLMGMITTLISTLIEEAKKSERERLLAVAKEYKVKGFELETMIYSGFLKDGTTM